MKIAHEGCEVRIFLSVFQHLERKLMPTSAISTCLFGSVLDFSGKYFSLEPENEAIRERALDVFL